MKMVSFRVRNFDKEQFLTYDIDNEAELDEDVLDFLEDEEPHGIVPVIFEDDDEEFDTFSYDITDKIHLSELSNQEINAEMVLMVLRGIVIALADMAEYRIPLSYLVLNRDYIYIDSDYKVEFICIPLEEMQDETDINSFLRNFIASLRFDVTEDVSYVARLLTYINNTAIFNLHNLLTMVEELMEDHGIEIPEDNSSEIYADYQEVEEKSAVDLVEELDEVDDLEEQAEEEVSDDVQTAEEDIPKEEEPEEETVQPEEEKVSDETEPQKSDLNSKFSIKQPAEDDEEYEEEPEDESEDAEPKKSSLSGKFSIKQPVEDDEEAEYKEEESEDAEPKKSDLSNKFSLKEPEPDEEETAVTEEEAVDETDIQSDEEVAVEEPEKQSEETVDEEEISEEAEEEIAGDAAEEELPEEDQVQEEEMSEEIESPAEEDIPEEEPSEEDELEEDEPTIGEAVQEPAEEEIAEDVAEDESSEEDAKDEAVTDSTAQEIVNKLKNKVIGGKRKTNTSEKEESGEGEEDKKKPVFKTKEITGVVIPDELDEFLAEKEREEQESRDNRREESSLKIKKNIKVNRASIVKNNQEELKESEPAEEETEAASGKADASGEIKNDGRETATDTGAEQNGGKAGILKSASTPKVNPYLVRVNTEERIMITKQTFKLGKASMGVDYTVKDNGAVSRVHAIITNKDGEYFVKDNKSTNHTYVNGKILNDGDNEPLTHDSKIMLGDEEFIFKLQ